MTDDERERSILASRTAGQAGIDHLREPRWRSLRQRVAELVLDTTIEGIWLIDAESRTTFVNHHAAALLGYTEDEMVGRSIFDFVDGQRRPEAAHNVLRRRSGVAERMEVQMLRKDGGKVWVIGSANPVFDRDGQYAGALALFGDLTPQKERGADLLRQVSELRQKLPRPLNERGSPEREPDPRPTVAGVVRTGLVCGAFVAVVGLAALGGVASALIAPKGSIDHESGS